jgi:GNAT superfamily N-acetyltransferase
MTVREAIYTDIPAIARVHVDTWRTTYKGIFSDEYLANLSYEKRESGWLKILNNTLENDFIYVAQDALGEIIGFASGGLERTANPIYKGELSAIYILENHQHKGLGRRLVQAVAHRLGQRRIYSMLAWVLADNPACGFYATLGGQKVYEKQIERDGTMLLEVAYGWIDTTNLTD